VAFLTCVTLIFTGFYYFVAYLFEYTGKNETSFYLNVVGTVFLGFCWNILVYKPFGPQWLRLMQLNSMIKPENKNSKWKLHEDFKYPGFICSKSKESLDAWVELRR